MTSDQPVDTAHTPVLEAEHRAERVYPSDPATCAGCEQFWPCDFERGRELGRERIVAMLRRAGDPDNIISPGVEIKKAYLQLADLIESEASHE